MPATPSLSPLDSYPSTKHVGAIKEDASDRQICCRYAIFLNYRTHCIASTKDFFGGTNDASTIEAGLRHVKGFRASSGIGFRDETYACSLHRAIIVGRLGFPSYRCQTWVKGAVIFLFLIFVFSQHVPCGDVPN